MKYYLKDDSFGLIEVTQRAQSRNLTLRVESDVLKVSTPYYVGRDTVLSFVKRSKDTITKARNKIKVNSKITPDYNLKTYSFDVSLQSSNEKTFRGSLNGRTLTVYYPENCNPSDPEISVYIKKVIEHFLSIEAQRLIPLWVDRLASRLGFRYNSVKINSAGCQWGSCSARKDIHISYFVMLLPEELIEGVLLHELCHTVHMNHSSEFWKLYNMVTGGRKEVIEKEIKEYRPKL